MATIRKRSTKRNGTRYTVTVRIGGQSKSATFNSAKAAKAWAEERHVALRHGHEVITDGRHTLQEALDAYRAALKAKPRGIGRDRELLLDWWGQRLGGRAIGTIKRPELFAIKDELVAAGKSASTSNHLFSALRSAFAIAVARGWVGRNPVSDTGFTSDQERLRRTEPRGRVRYLSAAERTRLLEACQASPEPALYPLVLLALSTGARVGELLGLEWQDVDVERGHLGLRDTKNGEARGVPVRGPALDVLRQLRAQHDDRPPGRNWVLRARSGAGGSAWNYRRDFLPAVKAARLDQHFRFHDLRHSAASYLVQAGLSLPVVGKLLGHKTPSMTQRYAHLASDHLTEASDRLAAILGGAP